MEHPDAFGEIVISVIECNYLGELRILRIKRIKMPIWIRLIRLIRKIRSYC
jgi:hypothetical protein